MSSTQEELSIFSEEEQMWAKRFSDYYNDKTNVKPGKAPTSTIWCHVFLEGLREIRRGR